LGDERAPAFPAKRASASKEVKRYLEQVIKVSLLATTRSKTVKGFSALNLHQG
jgi:hypothetical protein